MAAFNVLPAELVRNVVEFAGQADLRNIRLANSQLRYDADAFLYEEVTIELRPASIQRLMRIAQHPQFCHNVRRVIIRPSYLDAKASRSSSRHTANDDTQHIRNLYSASHADGQVNRQSLDFMLARVDRPDLIVEEALRINRPEAPTQSFEDPDAMVELLSTALTQFPNLDSITLSGEAVVKEPLFNESASPVVRYPNVGVRFRCLIDVLQKTGIQLKHLVLDGEDIRAGARHLSKLPEASCLFASLQTLELRLADAARSNQIVAQQLHTRRTKPVLPMLLAHFAAITQLTIGDSCEPSVHGMGSLVAHIPHLPRLRTLAIANTCMSREELAQLAAVDEATVREIRLEDVQLSAEGSLRSATLRRPSLDYSLGGFAGKSISGCGFADLQSLAGDVVMTGA